MLTAGRNASFETHVAVVGHLINEIVGDASADAERLITFVVMSSVGKLGKRLNGVHARAFLDSEIRLNDDLKRVIQVGPLEARAVILLIDAIKFSPDNCKNLTGQLESGCISKDGLLEAWSLLIHTVQELQKRHKILDKRLKKKTATDKEITTATTDVLLILLLIDEVAYGNLVNYLMGSQVQVLHRSLERERTRRTGLAVVKVEGTPKEAPSSPQVEQVDDDEEVVLEDEDDEDLQDDIDIHSMKTDESASKGLPPFDTASSVQIRTWLRLLATSVNSTLSLVDQKRQHNSSRKIVFNVLLCDQPSIQVDWKKTIYDIFKNGAKTLIRKLRNEFPVLTDDRLDFSGSPHCEASLGALCSATTMRKEVCEQANHKLSRPLSNVADLQAVDGQQIGLLSRTSPALNIFGISKLCCPVCWLILGHLNQDRPVITSGYHTKFIPCTFPPHLPTDVMERVVAIVQGHLKIALSAFTPKVASSHQRRELLAAQAKPPPTEDQSLDLADEYILEADAEE